MKVKSLGHASFLITSDNGTRIITDPYMVGLGIDYGEIQEAADVVLVSHDHPDHGNATTVQGAPEVIQAAGSKEVKGIAFKGIASFHDTAQGKERGPNTIFSFAVDGIKACFLGDLGHQLDSNQLAEIGEVDLLLVPIGGLFTIDANEATQVCDTLKPKVVIPMHYKTDKCIYPIAEVDTFLEGKQNVRRENTSEAEFKKDNLPSSTEVVVLQHAL